MKRHRHSTFFFVYLAALAVLGLFTAGKIGITWDEPNYFTSSYSYLSWFAHAAENPADWWASIDRYWQQSHEAPPFFKLWAGVFAGAAALVFGAENLDVLGDAYRLGSYVLFLAATYAAFRFTREEFGPVAGWGVALSMPLIPAVFGFARLGQLDGPAAFMYLLAAVALYQMLAHGGSVVWAGVLLGLAFATKLTVFTLPLAALLWIAVYRRWGALWRLAASCAIGAAVFFAIWPWLWPEPLGRTWEFLTWASGLQDERLTYYLGEWWAGAPFHYPYALLLAVVPLVVAAAALVGATRMFADRRNPASGWVLTHLLLILAVAGSGLVPVYGGPRQFLAAFPLWAICAGVGVGWVASCIRLRPAPILALYLVLALPGVLWTGASNSLEYYGGAVGFIPGARALGFETTYLADTYSHAVEYLDENAPEGATVYAQAGTYPVLESYRRTGELRQDLRPAYLSPIAPDIYPDDRKPREGSYFLFLPRQSIYTDQMLALEEKKPLYAYKKGGVPLVKVYSGNQVEGTLDVGGSPGFNDPGVINALASGTILGGALLLLWRQQKHDKERKQQ